MNCKELKKLNLNQLRLLQLKVENRIRENRVRTTLKTLAGMRTKCLGVKKYEQELSRALQSGIQPHIDAALDVLDLYIGIDTE